MVDEQGVKWKAKLGEETKSETAAARLVWAAGYFTDEDYYLPELRVEKMPKLSRGHQFVSDRRDGPRRPAGAQGKRAKKTGNWSWFKNPLTGTKELNGLRIMMALINNWDLKEINNGIYDEAGEGPRYVVSDLGASFGQTGNPGLTRSKNNPDDYTGSHFIQKVTPEHVDFYLSSRPFFLSAVTLPTMSSARTCRTSRKRFHWPTPNGWANCSSRSRMNSFAIVFALAGILPRRWSKMPRWSRNESRI